MIYIMCSAVIENNEFIVKSLYVVGENEGWMLTKSNNWTPVRTKLTVERMKSIHNAQSYYSSPLVYSPIRQHDDDDPKSFADFLRTKVRSGYTTGFNKKLFKVISNVGEEYASD